MNDVESCGKATAISFLTLYIISGSVVNLYDTLPVPRVSTSAQYGTIIGTLRFNGNSCGVKSLRDSLKEMSPLFN